MRVPMGVTHHFRNTSKELVQLVGFYIGADTPAARGFEAAVTTAGNILDNALVIHWDDVTPENMNKDEG